MSPTNIFTVQSESLNLLAFKFLTIFKMEQMIHFKGFSACFKCSGRFKTWEDPESPSQHESVHQARILFHIGNGPNDLQKFFKVLEEFDQQRIMPRCCFLVEVLSNKHDYGTSSTLLDAIEPENVAHGGSSVSQAPVLEELRRQQSSNWEHAILATAEGPAGYDFSSRPSQQEQEIESIIPRAQTSDTAKTEDDGIRAPQIMKQAETLLNENSTNQSTTPKRRKSNKSRKSSKKKKLKNSF